MLVGGVKSHGSFKPLSVLGLVVGWRVSRMLANCFEGRLILAKRELTLPVRGDLASCSDCRSLGIAVVVMMALLVDFSLEIEVRIVMSMVVIILGVV